MRDFQKFIKKNRREMYAVAYGNCQHDEEGHCIIPKDNPWMNDTVWHESDHQGRNTLQQRIKVTLGGFY